MGITIGEWLKVPLQLLLRRFTRKQFILRQGRAIAVLRQHKQSGIFFYYFSQIYLLFSLHQAINQGIL